MTTVVQRERRTQNRVVDLFHTQLDYDYFTIGPNGHHSN